MHYCTHVLYIAFFQAPLYSLCILIFTLVYKTSGKVVAGNEAMHTYLCTGLHSYTVTCTFLNAHINTHMLKHTHTCSHVHMNMFTGTHERGHIHTLHNFSFRPTRTATKKPEAILDYNKHSGPTCELLQLPSQVRQVVAQVFFLLLEVVVVNSYIISKELAMKKSERPVWLIQ